MRRDNDRRLIRAFQIFGPGRERVQSVGVNDHRRGSPFHHLAHKGSRALVTRRKSGADGDDRTLLRELQRAIESRARNRAVVGLFQGFGHYLSSRLSDK
jgi:hypothetical protein